MRSEFERFLGKSINRRQALCLGVQGVSAGAAVVFAAKAVDVSEKLDKPKFKSPNTPSLYNFTSPSHISSPGSENKKETPEQVVKEEVKRRRFAELYAKQLLATFISGIAGSLGLLQEEAKRP